MILGALASPSACPAAQGPYEPNDTILSGAGPLAVGQTYVAGLETPGDRDFFFFYATATPTSQVTLTVGNLGGGAAVSNVNATILDSSATSVAALPYVNRGESRTIAVSLKPQKYFIEIAASEGYGDAYSLTTSGSDGAFGPYGRIAAECGKATTEVTAARAALKRAEAKLQRATNRVRRSRYSSSKTREAAHIVHRQARARVTAARKALDAVNGSQKPWCFIPQ